MEREKEKEKFTVSASRRFALHFYNCHLVICSRTDIRARLASDLLTISCKIFIHVFRKIDFYLSTSNNGEEK